MRGLRHAACLVVVAAAAAVAWADPPDVPAEIKAEPGQLVRIVVKTDAEIGYLKNFTDADGFFGELVSPKGQRQFVFQPPAKNPRASYTLGFWTKGETEGVATTIVVSGVTPVPPGPGPQPPTPPDPDDAAPISLPGFRVMIVYDNESDRALGTGQRAAIFGQAVREYLDRKAVKGPDGVTPEYRIYGDDLDLSGEAEHWRKAYQAASASGQLPYLIVSNGKTGYSGPLPDGLATTLTLLKKHGGE